MSLNRKTRPSGPLKGIWNSQRQERLPFGTMQQADNVTVDNTGTVERRSGYSVGTQFVDATDGTDCDHLEYCIVVDDGTLLSVAADMTKTTIATGLTEGTYQWAQVEDRVAFAGETEAGLILGGTTLLPLRVPVPESLTFSPSAGTLPVGVYQFSAVYRHIASGIEGGAMPSTAYTLAAPAAIIVGVTVPTGYEADIFATTVDDTVERYIGTTTTTLVYSDPLTQMEEPLEDAQVNAIPLPEGITALCFHEGSLYAAIYDESANLGVVLCSEPYFYHLFKPVDPDLGNIGVSARVLGMGSTSEGLVVATERAIFVHNDGVLTKLADGGAVVGKPVAKDLGGTVSIWTDWGLVTFPKFRSRFEINGVRKLSVPPGDWVSNHIVEHNGLYFNIALSDGAGTAFNGYTAPTLSVPGS